MKKMMQTIAVSFLLFAATVVFFGVCAKNVPIGDVNDDGRITAADARLVLRASAKLTVLTDEQMMVADADGSGVITASDARKILRIAAKLDAPLGYIDAESYEDASTAPTVIYLNSFMDRDNEELTLFAADCRGEKMDGFVFQYKDQLILLDGGFSGSDIGSVCHYLEDLRRDLLPQGVPWEDARYKLKLILTISHFHVDHVQTLIRDILHSPYYEIDAVYAAAQSDFENTTFFEDESLCSKTNYADGFVTNKGRLKFFELMAKHSPDADIVLVPFGETRSFQTHDGNIEFTCFGPSQDWGTQEHAQKILDLYYNGGTAANTQTGFPTAVVNANSMWMKVTYGETDMLFTGDVMKRKSFAYAPGDESYVGEPFDLMLSYYGEKCGGDIFDADIVKFPHHGTKRPYASKGVFEVFSPSVVLCTAADYRDTTVKKAHEYWNNYTGDCYLAENGGLYIRLNGKDTAVVEKK